MVWMLALLAGLDTRTGRLSRSQDFHRGSSTIITLTDLVTYLLLHLDHNKIRAYGGRSIDGPEVDRLSITVPHG